MEGMGSVMKNGTDEFGPATFEDILIPPLIALLLMIFGLLMLSWRLQPQWWKHHMRRSSNKAVKRDEVITAPKAEGNLFAINGAPRIAPQDTGLLSPEDNEILTQFQMFQNNPMAMFKLALPSLTSVGFCPITIIFQPVMIDFFYPESIGGRINTNDSLAVFLLPAGLVYAMAFGFALQDSLAKFDVTTATAGRHVTILRQCRHLIGCSKMLSTNQKLELFRCLGRSTTKWMAKQMDPQRCKPCNEVWQILEILQSCEAKGGETKVLDELFSKSLELESISEEGYTGAGANINILQWAFMELLGFVAFFGILLVVADSYRLELVMCVLTVFSISAFVYILGDLDHAYHGTFRVDLGVFVGYLRDLEGQYDVVKALGSKISTVEVQDVS